MVVLKNQNRRSGIFYLRPLCGFGFFSKSDFSAIFFSHFRSSTDSFLKFSLHTYAVFRYNRNTSTYENWGMSSSLVNQAWEVSPENVTVSYTTGSDTESFNIDHRP